MQYSSTTNYTRDEDRGGRDLGQGQASGLALVHRLLESVKKRCMQVASIDPATRCFNLRPRYTRPLKTERVASFSTFPSIRFSPRCSSSNILTLDRFHEHECIANRVTCIREERNVNYIGGRGLFYATASVPLLSTLSAPTKLYFQRPPRAYVKSVINEGGALNLTLKFLKSDPLSLRYCILYVSSKFHARVIKSETISVVVLSFFEHFLIFPDERGNFHEIEIVLLTRGTGWKGNSRFPSTRDIFIFHEWKNFYPRTNYLPSFVKSRDLFRGYVPRTF